MDNVLVVSLILALVFTRLSFIEATEKVQNEKCPPGYHTSTENCLPAPCCKPCIDKMTYTAISNTHNKCFRCSQCGRVKIKKNCTTTSNIVCHCKAGEYSTYGHCQPCSTPPTDPSFSNEDYLEMCLPCHRPECLENQKCKEGCAKATTSITTKARTTVSAIGTPSTTRNLKPPATKLPVNPLTTASPTGPAPPSGIGTLSTTRNLNPTSTKLPDNSNNLFMWLSFVGASVTSLALFWFLLLFCKSLLREEYALPCWKRKKMERPQELTESHRHHCGSPTTLTLNISEESPILSPCHEPPPHNMQKGVHIDPRRYEQSERWPAILLYEIIKEVPLRRWKEFLRLLSVPDQQMERVELETCLGSIEKQYQMLRLWSQRPSANLNDVYSSLHHMDLSGCAQQLQENLERLQWSWEGRQGIAV